MYIYTVKENNYKYFTKSFNHFERFKIQLFNSPQDN